MKHVKRFFRWLGSFWRSTPPVLREALLASALSRVFANSEKTRRVARRVAGQLLQVVRPNTFVPAADLEVHLRGLPMWKRLTDEERMLFGMVVATLAAGVADQLSTTGTADVYRLLNMVYAVAG